MNREDAAMDSPMAMDLIRHIAGLYSGKAIKGDFTQIYITGNEIWMAQQILASQQGERHPEQAEGAQGEHSANIDQQLLDWNRSHSNPPIEIGSEYWVAQEAMRLASAALAQPSPSYAGFPKPTVLKDCDVRYAANAQPSPTENALRDALTFGTGILSGGAHIPLQEVVQPSPAPELDFTTGEWERCQQLADLPRIHELLQAFGDDPSGDSGVMIVREVLLAAEPERLISALRHKAELYDEVWELATSKGYMNVTTAIARLEQERDAALAKLAAMEQQEATWQFKSKCGDGWKETRHDNLEALLREGYEIRQIRAPVAKAGQVPEGWSGWVTQYPNSMPKLWGDRRIAELNWHPEQGQHMFRVAEVERAAAPQPAGGAE